MLKKNQIVMNSKIVVIPAKAGMTNIGVIMTFYGTINFYTAINF